MLHSGFVQDCIFLLFCGVLFLYLTRPRIVEAEIEVEEYEETWKWPESRASCSKSDKDRSGLDLPSSCARVPRRTELETLGRVP